MFGAVYADADPYCEQLDRVNLYLSVHRLLTENVQHDNVQPHCTRRALQKLIRLG